MFSDFTIRELEKIFCGDSGDMPYLSGPKLVEFFNKFGFRDKEISFVSGSTLN